MKKFTFLSILLALMWSAGANAYDEPEPSKDGKVRWYFLKTAGSAAAGCYWTVVGDFVYAREKADYTDYETMAKQLWSFETEDGEWYTLTNRYDGRKLGVGYGTFGESLMLHDTVQAKFQLREVGDALGFKSDRPVDGGGDIFLFPAVGGSSYDFVVWLIREKYSGSSDCGVTLEEYTADTYLPQNSETVTWYNIVTAENGAGGEVIADNTSVVDSKYKFTVESKDASAQNTQWRFVETSPGKTAIINRATGNSISTTLSSEGRYNIPVADAITKVATTWNLLPVSETQYIISSVGADKIMRMLNAQTVGEDPIEISEENPEGTSVAWTFSMAGTQVGADEAIITPDTAVEVADGKIITPAGAKVTITTPDGIVLPPDTRLSAGIYIVTINGKTTKILVH